MTARELALGRGGDQVVIKNNSLNACEILVSLKKELELGQE